MQVEILIMLRKPHIQRFDAISTQQPLIDNQYIQIAYYTSHHQPYLQGFELFHSMMGNHFTDSKGVWQPPLYTSSWSGLPPFLPLFAWNPWTETDQRFGSSQHHAHHAKTAHFSISIWKNTIFPHVKKKQRSMVGHSSKINPPRAPQKQRL